MTPTTPSSLEIAQAAILRPISDVAADLGVAEEHLEHYGKGVAKIDLAVLDDAPEREAASQLRRRHRRHADAAGGGQDHHERRSRRRASPRAVPVPWSTCVRRRWVRRSGSRAVPPEVATARSCRWSGSTCTSPATSTRSPPPTTCWRRWSTTTCTTGAPSGLDPRNVIWRRVLDVNDRSLRNVVIGLGARMDGVPRESGFDITAASEVMVILTLSHVAARPARAARPDRGRHDRVRRTGHRRGPRRRGRDGRDLEGRDQAQPPADARGRPGARALRPVRQHRHRYVVGDRRPDRAVPRGRRGHRGRLRLRHGRRAVLRREVPGGRARARPGGRGRDGALDEGPLGSLRHQARAAAAAGSARGEPGRRTRRSATTCGRTSGSSGASGSRRSSRSTRSPTTTTPSTRCSCRRATSSGCGAR